MIKQLDKWHKTKLGFLVFALVELAIAYLFASLSINSGSLWQYVLTLAFFFGSLKNFVKLIGSFFHGKH